MNKRIRKIIEKNNWFIHEGKDYLEISQPSPAGEDFFFTINNNNIINDILDYAENFDADEHAKLWVENMHEITGIPQSIRILIDDADAIQEMLDTLESDLRKYKEKQNEKNIFSSI